MYDIWIIITAVLSAIACALLGNFLVLRRLSMMADAISHAVLPGLAIAFMITHSRASIVMFCGAALLGLLTALLTQWILHCGKVEQGAAMGVVFTTLFAIGLILIQVKGAHAVDLDPDCVLYGAIEFTPLDKIQCWGFRIPRAVLTLTIVSGINLLFVSCFYKELKISSFDPELATTLGFNAQWMHYLLMSLVAITAVAAFESVGSILVIAMFIVPAATAYLLTERLLVMILISVLVAATCASAGHLSTIVLANFFNAGTNTAGMMVLIAGGIFSLALFLAPRHGILSRFIYRLAFSFRVAEEDILTFLYRLEETEQLQSAKQSRVWLRKETGLNFSMNYLIWQGLLWRHKIKRSEGSYQLTQSGRRRAQQLLRSHHLGAVSR